MRKIAKVSVFLGLAWFLVIVIGMGLLVGCNGEKPTPEPTPVPTEVPVIEEPTPVPVPTAEAVFPCRKNVGTTSAQYICYSAENVTMDCPEDIGTLPVCR